jgi:DNA-binding beta-propeller fold protein YncE
MKLYRFLTSIFISMLPAVSVVADQYLSGHEGKIILVDGAGAVNPNPEPDRLMLVDTTRPENNRMIALSNSVIGPPSNLSYSPESGYLLVADSMRISEGEMAPEHFVSILSLQGGEMKPVSRVRVGLQPSGVDLNAKGEMALVANRLDGTISVLKLESGLWYLAQTVQVATAEGEVTDVSFTPDQQHAVFTVRESQKLGLLTLDPESGKWHSSQPLVDLPGKPYRVVVDPAGRYAYTNLAHVDLKGAGSLVSIRLEYPKMVVDQIVDLGIRSPESVEISPDGKWLMCPMMAGSNLAKSDPDYDKKGRLLIYEKGDRLSLFQTIACGAIPEGTAFSKDANEIILQSHPNEELEIYVRSSSQETFVLKKKIPVEGYPSSLIPLR